MKTAPSLKSVSDHLQTIVSLADDLGVADRKSKDHPQGTSTVQSIVHTICDQAAAVRPTTLEPVRTLHHFSCTGGTMIAKCIASMANTLVLNEIDMLSQIPFARAHKNFTPTDIVSLLYQSGTTPKDDLVFELFTSSIKSVRDHCHKRGQSLVLRDHSHSHYLYGTEPRLNRTMLESLQQAGIDCLTLVTVRNPVHSYHSMYKMGWHTHMRPSSFEEYCKRYLAFLNAYRDAPIVKYEDFAENPKLVMRAICGHLQLSFFEAFEEVFSTFQFSGDSGRGSGEISVRPSLELPDNLVKEVRASDTYPKLSRRLDYPLIESSD